MRAGLATALIGAQLTGVQTINPTVIQPRPTPIIIGTVQQETIGVDIRAITQSFPNTNNYPTANTAMFIPFGIAESIIAVKLWVHNGTAVAGNIDLGIYRPDGSQVVAKGSTAQAGTSTIQELDITDTPLVPGRYYLAINSDTSGATQKVWSYTLTVAGLAGAMGVLQAALGHVGLDASVTFATCTQTLIPLIGLSTRTLVV
jgi:hypothetical protein